VPALTDPRIIRLALDINVLVADLLAARAHRRGNAATMIVDTVRDGACPAGPVQLVTSLPIIENYASVLRRHFGYTAAGADEKAWLLDEYARAGPLQDHPHLPVASSYIPFETEEQLRQSIQNHAGVADAAKLFHEIQDDRYVLETALAGKADILVTSDIAGFVRGPAIRFQRNDVVLFPFAARALVIATPSFAAHWLRQGIVPDNGFIADHPTDFVQASGGASLTR
jgi:hypothetical protein